MKEIPLTRGLVALIDDEDYAAVSKFKWHAQWSRRTFYAKRRDGDKHVALHQILIPGVLQIDHRDGNGLNNQRSNLRSATAGENSRNRGPNKNNASGWKGVSWYKAGRKWRATIYVQGKNRLLGSFDDSVEAAKAYDAAARELHGQFARLNFPI